MITRCHHFGAAVHTNTTTTTIVKEWDFASISKDQQPCSAPRYPSSSSLIDHHFYFTIDGLLSPTSLIVSTRQLYYSTFLCRLLLRPNRVTQQHRLLNTYTTRQRRTDLFLSWYSTPGRSS